MRGPERVEHGKRFNQHLNHLFLLAKQRGKRGNGEDASNEQQGDQVAVLHKPGGKIFAPTKTGTVESP